MSDRYGGLDDTLHEGELLVQDRTGEAAIAAQVGAGISDLVIPGARGFLAAQRMVAIASVDEAGTPWASVLLGAPGFATATGGRSVIVDLAKAIVDPADPVRSNLRLDGPIGLLAIELGTRRRLRINGRISRLTETAIEVSVREAYPNCPKYIQRRRLVETAGVAAGEEAASGTALDAAREQLIARADTLFVASQHPSRGADVSHRGGEPGFVRALDATTLRVPDYRGNSLFNTLGNFAVAPAAGLAILDFERARILQLAGHVVLHFDLPEDPGQPSGGTGRYWDLHLSRWIERSLPLGLRWQLLDTSRYNPAALRSP